MTRTLPHHYIERASRPEPGSVCDDELRHRCRSAPIWIRRTMNARREERGLPPLWPGIGSHQPGVTARGQGRPPRPARPAAASTIARLKAFLTLQRAR